VAYHVKQLAEISGVTARTLRYYDRLGLLSPSGVRENGYRYYEAKEVDRLQQILVFRELGLPLMVIGEILDAPGFDRGKALEEHLQALRAKRRKLDQLIETVKKTIDSEKGEREMSDREKFEGLKKQMVEDNERAYGDEIRQAYGHDMVDAANLKLMDMDESRLSETETLRARCEETLKRAMKTGGPGGALAQEACAMHRQWLMRYWPEGSYSKEAHRGLGEMYVSDLRFTSYYDAIAPGMAAFLRDALDIYCAN
jgi:DNA-binding transcriptional MerR regulator